MNRLSLFSLLSLMLMSISLCFAETRLMSDHELAGISGQNGLLSSMLQNRLIFDLIDTDAEQLEQLKEHERRFIELELNFTHGSHIPAQVATEFRNTLQSSTAISSAVVASEFAISIPFVGKIYIPVINGGGLFGQGGGFGITPDLSVTLQIPEEDEDRDD